MDCFILTYNPGRKWVSMENNQNKFKLCSSMQGFGGFFKKNTEAWHPCSKMKLLGFFNVSLKMAAFQDYELGENVTQLNLYIKL